MADRIIIDENINYDGIPQGVDTTTRQEDKYQTVHRDKLRQSYKGSGPIWTRIAKSVRVKRHDTSEIENRFKNKRKIKE